MSTHNSGAGHTPGKLSPEDARRMVACWNACEGLSTSGIEAIAALGGVQHKMPVAAGLVAERDELLRVLRELVEAVEDNERDSLRELIAAHAAIARATTDATRAGGES